MLCSSSIPGPCTGMDYLLTLHTHAAAKRSLSGKSLNRCSSADIRQPCPDTMRCAASRFVCAFADWVKASDGWVILDSEKTGNRSSLTSQLHTQLQTAAVPAATQYQHCKLALSRGSHCLRACGSLCTWRHLVLALRKSILSSCSAASGRRYFNGLATQHAHG